MNKQEFVELISSTKFLLIVALLLTGFTHLWNVSQFPTIHVDEGTYIRRALHVLNGLGPQENTSWYDHPFMGQIVLAQFFAIIDYPNSINPSTLADSIQILYTVPRIFIGLLSILDTFLVFIIARYSYNKNVAFVAAILFAVTPMSWQLRRVVLESIQLPFVLTSILLAFLIKEKVANYGHNKITVLILLSGILLGMAIFTKIPAISIIPFVSYLIIKYSGQKIRYSNENQKQKNYNLKNLGIWFIPVILIPLIWPAYALWVGEFDRWTDGVLGQAIGRGSTVPRMWESFIIIDPVLLSIVVGGLIFSLKRKDLFPLLWMGPFVLFVLVTEWFVEFHWNLLLPAFCIYGAVLLVELPNRIMSVKMKKYAHVTIIGIVTVFGFISITLLISLNLSTGIFQAAATTLQYLNLQLKENKTTEDFSIIASPIYTWLFKYPFKINNTIDYRDKVTINTPNVIFVADGLFRRFIEPYEKNLNRNASDSLHDNDSKTRFVGRSIGSWMKIDLGSEKKICGIKLWWYKGDGRSYNFTLSISNDNMSFREIDSYKSNAQTMSEEYESNNTTGRYLVIHFNGNTDNDIGSISEMALYGNHNVSNIGECSELVPKKIVLSNNSYLETGGNNRIELIARILSQSKVTSEIDLPTEYNSHFYPFTSIGRYTSTPHIEIRVK